MIVGIIGAMECEVKEIKEAMELRNTHEVALMKFFTGNIEGIDVVVVCCGTGKVNAAMATQLLVDKFDVNYIINAGVAGAISEKLNICDIVISSELTYHDFDSRQLMNSYPWMSDIFIKADPKLIAICQRACNKISLTKKSYVGRIVSGDKFISSSEEKKIINDKFNALCIEMEGASIAHVCYANKIPFVIVRSISDNANESASMNFKEFLKLASQQLNQLIIAVIKELSQGAYSDNK